MFACKCNLKWQYHQQAWWTASISSQLWQCSHCPWTEYQLQQMTGMRQPNNISADAFADLQLLLASLLQGDGAVKLMMAKQASLGQTQVCKQGKPGTNMECLIPPSLLATTKTPLLNLTAMALCNLTGSSTGLDAPARAGLKSVHDWHLKALPLSASSQSTC